MQQEIREWLQLLRILTLAACRSVLAVERTAMKQKRR
jgi:hypothetical protein